MIRKSAITGILLGLILTVIALYPVFVVYVGPALPDIGNSLESMLGEITLAKSVKVSMALPLLMGLAGAASLISLGVGTIAALRCGSTSFLQGAIAGMISGLFTGFVLYIFVIAPTTTVISASAILSFELGTHYDMGAVEYPIGMVIPFAHLVVVGELKYLLITLLISVAGGGLQGGATGWLRRKHAGDPGPSSLLDCIDDPRGYRVWFRHHDEPILVGMATGLVGGLILVLSDLLNRSASTDATDPLSQWLTIIFKEAATINILKTTDYLLLPVLMTMSVLVVVGVGGVAAFLPKTRLDSCIRACLPPAWRVRW